MNNYKSQPKKRKEQIKLLETHLKNPGRFSILILGDRGTGKKFWIKHLAEKQSIGNLVQLNAKLALNDQNYWEEKLKASDKGILIIEDVENLDTIAQEVLFEALSTWNGKFGFSDKIYEVRIVFTSSKSISSLRDTEKYLIHKFFDRIAQLVVRFPNFNECGNKIKEDFKYTWKKFLFDTPYPELLEEWLLINHHKLYGNFRDLDKLCINWNNYQLMGKTESEIFDMVKDNFSTYYHFPEYIKENFYEVHFSKEETYKEMLDNFKAQLKRWADAEFSSFKEAAKSLGISYRTFERW